MEYQQRYPTLIMAWAAAIDAVTGPGGKSNLQYKTGFETAVEAFGACVSGFDFDAARREAQDMARTIQEQRERRE